ENAATLAAAEAARAELRERGIEPGHEPDRVTAEEWLAAEDRARREDDPHRRVTEIDVAAGSAAPAPTDEPTEHADRIDAQVAQARQALAELADRRSAEEARLAYEAEEQVAREAAWRRQDEARVAE